MTIIAVCSPSFCQNEQVRSLAYQTFHPKYRLVFADLPTEMRPPQLVAFLQGANIAIIGKEQITRDLLAQIPGLQAISKYGVGLDNVDIEACKQFGVRVLWKAGVNADSAAEHTIGLMLSAIRNISRSDRLFHQGIWWKNGGNQLIGKKVGIIGFGAIGSRVASMLKAFRCSILVNEIDIQKDNAIRIGHHSKVSLDELIQESDIISLHVPLTTQTHHLIDAAKFKNMKPNAILINTSRGKVIDQAALKEALKNNIIQGAGLDVFETEPVLDPELFKLENLVATAHMAGNSQEAVLAMGKAAIDGVREFLLNRCH